MSWLSCFSTAKTASAGTDAMVAGAACKGWHWCLRCSRKCWGLCSRLAVANEAAAGELPLRPRALDLPRHAVQVHLSNS